MYIPISGLSRSERRRKRRGKSKLSFLANTAVIVACALLLTLLIPTAVPDLKNPFSGAIFTVSGHQQPPPAPPKTEYAVVYVSGAVAAPGVVKVPLGTTVAEVIRLAGGLTAEADAGKLDLSRPVKDEMQIHINKIAAPPAKKK